MTAQTAKVKAIAKIDDQFVEIGKITKEDVKKFFCEKATDNEIALFLKIALLNGLNPFKRELYLVKYGEYPASIVTGYEVYLKRADRTQKCDGYRAWTEGEGANMKAKIEIFRKDWKHPFTHEIEYSEYVQRKANGEVNIFWKTKPKTMCKKVVTAQGFRLAFPDEMGGLPYIQEEVNAEEVREIKEIPDMMPKAKDTPKVEVVEAIEPAVIEASELSQPEETKTERPLPEGFVMMKAKYNGICRGGCTAEVKIGDEVAFSKKRGIYHADCITV